MWRLQFDVYENLNWLFPSTPLSWKLWCYICLTYQLIHWFYLHWHKCLCNWKRSTLCAQKSWWWFIQRRWWWRDKDSQAVVSGISTIISAAWHFVNMRFGYHCPVDGSTGINFNTSQLSGMTSGFLPWTHDQLDCYKRMFGSTYFIVIFCYFYVLRYSFFMSIRLDNLTIYGFIKKYVFLIISSLFVLLNVDTPT